MACAALHSPRDAPEGGCTVQNLSAAGGGGAQCAGLGTRHALPERKEVF